MDLPPCVVCTSPQELALLLVTPGASCQADAGLIMGLKEPAAFICTSVPDFKFQYLKLVAVCAAWEAEQRRAREKSAASVASLVGSGGKDDGPDIVQPPVGDPDDPMDPIDAMSDNDFDGPEDTPAVDLGF